MDTFLPKGAKVPTAGNYFKMAQGENIIRVLSPAIVGYEYWNADKKPVRSREEPAIVPPGTNLKYFWAFVCYNVKEEKIQIAEFTQKTILMALEALCNNGKWGDIREYDVTITRTGTTMNDTEYAVVPNPKEKVPASILEAYKAKKIDLEALYEGADPFTGEKKDDPMMAYNGKVKEKSEDMNIPFK